MSLDSHKKPRVPRPGKKPDYGQYKNATDAAGIFNQPRGAAKQRAEQTAEQSPGQPPEQPSAGGEQVAGQINVSSAKIQDILGQTNPDLMADSLFRALENPLSKPEAGKIIQALIELAEHRGSGIQNFKKTFPQIRLGFVPPLARRIHREYRAAYPQLNERLYKAKRMGVQALQELEKTLSASEREFVKAISSEVQDTNRLLHHRLPNGYSKTPDQLQQDLDLLKSQILQEYKGMGRLHLETLITSERGRDLLDVMSKERSDAGKKLKDELTTIYIEKVMSQRLGDLDAGQIDRITRGDVPYAVLRIIAHDGKKWLTASHIKLLLDGNLTPAILEILEKNMGDERLNTDLIEKIMTLSPKEVVVNGELISFYDGAHIGEGGCGRVFWAAILEKDRKLRFVGCKSGDKDRIATEAERARLMLQLEIKGLDTRNIMKYRSVAENPHTHETECVFLEIYQYTEDSGRVFRGDLSELVKDSTVPENILYQTLLGGGKALAALEAVGAIQMDSKVDNYVPGESPEGPTGIHIDLAYVLPREKVINATLLRDPNIEGEYYIGRLPKDIGVTLGYYSEELMTEIIAGRVPPEKHHNRTFGVAIQSMLTGKRPLQKITTAGRVYELIDDIEARPLPIPPYAVGSNDKLQQLADELMDPHNPITMAQAVQRLEDIIKLP